ncbi:beta strand repeat-containing protein [Bdellovibrio sp. HCB274]|uniref:beta strand repeat-containing protein n=1 Tax=Bdellovibrio sp. HCB274 TaxID=3394361 RepID=UPI0039B43D31
MQKFVSLVARLLFLTVFAFGAKTFAVAWNYANPPGTYGDIEFTTNGTLAAGTYTFNNLTINSGVTVTISSDTSTTNGSGVVIFAASVNHLGTIDGNARGFSAGQGPGAGLPGSYSASGAGHGGLGAIGTGGTYVYGPGKAYGSAVDPTALGSGGGGSGGKGGGAIKFVVTGTMAIGGAINVNGGNGTSWDGGGSGGSISITADTITGTGALSSTGGTGPGAGSGGRIYLAYATSRTHSGTITVTGGGTAMPGSALIVKSSAPTSLTFPVNSTISNGTYVFNDITIPSGVTVSVTGLGYGANEGPGAGGVSYGNGHGAGYGGAGSGAAAGGTYGSPIKPKLLGSGGGLGMSSAASGGGAIHFSVAGTLTVTGTLAANGATYGADGWSGAGSGGSIWIEVGTLAGAGAITANGGTSGVGAGGGRIYIEYQTKTHTGSITASKSPSSTAVDGTVVLRDMTSNAFSCASMTIVVPGSDLVPLTALNVGAGCKLTVNGDISPTSVSVSGSGAVLNMNGNLLVSGSINVTTSGTLQVTGNKLLDSGYVVSAANLTIDSTSTMNADSTGFGGGFGEGVGSTNTYGGGGGYGGAGGVGRNAGAAGGATYGFPVNPTRLGSGGANSGGGGVGGAGGGAIILIVPGTISIAGTLSANGSIGTVYSGGGSGGSLWITVGTLSGAGYIRANGGNGIGGGGGGGGGRIYINFMTANTFTAANITVTGGAASGGTSAAGAAGTKNTTTGSVTASIAFLITPASIARRNSSFPQVPAVVGKDASGNIDSNFNSTVTLNAFTDASCTTPAVGVLSDRTAATPLVSTSVAGTAWFNGIIYNRSETIYIQGKSGSMYTGCAAVTVGGAIATQLVFTTQPSATTTAGVVFAQQPVIEARDADGVIDLLSSLSEMDIYSDASCTTAATVETYAGSGTLSSGVTTYTGVSYTKAGNWYFKASQPNTDVSATKCSSVFTITPATAAKLVFTRSPGNTNAGVNFTNQPIVITRDTYDNDTTYTGDIMFEPVADTGTCTSATLLTGTLSNPGPYSTTTGSVTGSGMSYTEARDLRLRASTTGLTTACSNQFTISAGTLASILWVTQPPTAANVNINFSSPVITVGGLDAYGNTKSMSSGTFTILAYTDATCTTAGVAADLTTSGTGFTSGNWRVNSALYKKSGTFYFRVNTGALQTACSDGTVFTLKFSPVFFRAY